MREGDTPTERRPTARQRAAARREQILETALKLFADWLLVLNEVGTAAGEYLFSLAIVGGSAWKMEADLARFFRRHLAGQVDSGHQALLSGLPGVEVATPLHAVQSVDWCHPTLG
jgi:hypothetical protein